MRGRWSALLWDSAVGLKVSARCSEAIRSYVDGRISGELQLCCCRARNKSRVLILRVQYYYCCFLCVCSIAVAAVEKGHAYLYFGRGGAAANLFFVAGGDAGAGAGACATSVLKQRRAPATVSSFYVSVLCTAMLRTSIAAVVLGCFYFCPLDCDALVMVVDCAAVKTGCMLEKYIPGTC